MDESWFLLLLLVIAGLWAGAQNTLAGGGSFITLSALVLAGLDPKLANIVSTVAMFPGQLVSAAGGRRLVPADASPSFAALAIVSFLGGAAGGMLLLLTPAVVFGWLVPWLVLFATGIFALSAVGKRPSASGRRLHPRLILALQFLVALYGGYYSGGIGFLMLALLGFSGMPLRGASAIKNILAAVLNSSAVIIFLATTTLPLAAVVALGAGSIAGNAWGVWVLRRIDERVLTIFIICLGLALSIGLFAKAM